MSREELQSEAIRLFAELTEEEMAAELEIIEKLARKQDDQDEDPGK